MIDYNGILQETLINAGELAKTLLGQAEDSAKQDTTAFFKFNKVGFRNLGTVAKEKMA